MLALGCGGSPTAPSKAAEPTPPAVSPYSETSYRRAAEITAIAVCDGLRSAAAGQREGDVKDVIQVSFDRQGSGPPAFATIVATGANAVDYHYWGSDGRLAEGDVVDIDAGATFDAVTSDVTRSFPVSARFSARQRDLYQLVLDVQKRAEDRVRSNGVVAGGYALAALHHWAVLDFQASPLRAKDAGGNDRTMDAFFTHALGHYVGRDVHGSDTNWNAQLSLQPGQVLTLEPGLYIASEGIGVRVEDTYLVTGNGLECLTCACPKEAADMERRAALATHSVGFFSRW